MTGSAPKGAGSAAEGAGLVKTSPLPTVLTIVGAVISAGAFAARYFVAAAAQAGPPRIAATMIGLAGTAVLVGGIVSLLFNVATARNFEWFLAWRYLRRSQRSYSTFIVGLLLLGVAGALLAASYLVTPEPIGGIKLGPTPLMRGLQIAALGVFRLGSWVLIFGTLLMAFSVFTCISIFGVYLGTSALVVVLSVMGGFEHDLRQKILGTRAHIVVRKPKSMFTEYPKTLAQVRAIPGVKAVTPFIESEVMITSQTNLSGVLLRGINPRTIGQVTDLSRYLHAPGAAGKLDNLLHPERLAKIPAVPFGAPRVPLSQASQPTSGPASQAASRPASGKQAVASSQPGAKRPTDRRPGGEAASRPVLGAGKKVLSPSSAPTLSPTTAPASQAATSQPGSSSGLGRVKPRAVFPGLIVGAELARNLRLYVGDDVNLVSPLGGMSPAGPIPKSRPFRIAGIFYSGMYEYDTKFAYVTIPEAQRFLGLDDEISGLEIKLDDVKRAEVEAQKLGATLGAAFEVRDWQRLNRNLFSALKLEKVVMFIVLVFIILVASFSIVTNLIMMVLEKSREIGALKAIGASHRSLLRVFIYAGMYIGAIGMLAGVVEGLAICTYLGQIGLPLDPEVYYISRLPVRMSAPDIAVVALASITLSFIATIYPAMRAGRLEPVDALRYD